MENEMANMQNQNMEKNKSDKNSNRGGVNAKGNSQGQQNQRQGQQSQDEEAGESEEQDQQGLGSKFPLGAIGTAVTSELVSKFASPVVEDIMSALNERFGKESVDSVLKTFNLPEDFDIKTLVDWDPIKNKIAKNPMASAALAAIGVGTLYLAREALAGRPVAGAGLFKKVSAAAKSSATGKKKAGAKKVAAKSRRK
jgi:hypothetical protein